ncbi:DUF6461 domain-containing protein [Streptomyces pseudovenezuelae]|uniref:DUF6461 domain-containing protein n=1 Tax=Streptomyces pseudovenezuelae TaxID=67350 RepID=UPI00381BD149
MSVMPGDSQVTVAGVERFSARFPQADGVVGGGCDAAAPGAGSRGTAPDRRRGRAVGAVGRGVRPRPVRRGRARGWALMVEFNGYLGVTDALMRPLSPGRRVVSHFLDVNAVDGFRWYEDGDLRLGFQPLFADERYASRPDELLAEMRESGLDLTERDEDGGHDDYYASLTGASFALAHRLTGIRVTPELFAVPRD